MTKKTSYTDNLSDILKFLSPDTGKKLTAEDVDDAVIRQMETRLLSRLTVLKAIDRLSEKMDLDSHQIASDILGENRILEDEDFFPELNDAEEVLPGVANLISMASRLGVSLEDMNLVSMWDADRDLIDAVTYNEYVFVMMGKEDSPAELALRLVNFGFRNIRLIMGTDIGEKNEKITEGRLSEFMHRKEKNAGAVIIHNEYPKMRLVTHGLPDEAFLGYEQQIMPSQEIRSIILSKLALTRSSVIYDIGAGSGTVSAECARLCVDGWVYAIERDPEKLQFLRGNKRKFNLENMEILLGVAPGAIRDLPVPTHAVISSSLGVIRQTMEILTGKNPSVRVVMKLNSLESRWKPLHS